MSRPKKDRCLYSNPVVYYYKPQGIPLRMLEEIALERDEFEAINFADLKNLSHEEAAEKMEISRATFGRIIKSARKKIAEAMIMGKAIKINK